MIRDYAETATGRGLSEQPPRCFIKYDLAWHDGDAGLEPGEAERQFRKENEGDTDRHSDVDVRNEQIIIPAADDVSPLQDKLERDGNDDELERQLDRHQRDGNVDGFLESLEKDPTQQQHQRDPHPFVMQRGRPDWVLDDVCRCIGRLERNGDDDGSGHEAKQAQDKGLPLRPGQKALQQGDRALAVGTALGDPAVEG